MNEGGTADEEELAKITDMIKELEDEEDLEKEDVANKELRKSRENKQIKSQGEELQNKLESRAKVVEEKEVQSKDPENEVHAKENDYSTMPKITWMKLILFEICGQSMYLPSNSTQHQIHMSCNSFRCCH